MKLTVLGSGAWDGIPAPFCGCAVCHLAITEPLSKNSRTRPEFFIETSQGAFLLEAGPDLRLQSTRFNLPPVKQFLISHWHFDHMYGLHELHTWIKHSLKQPLIINCSTGTQKVLKEEFSYLQLKVKIIEPLSPFYLYGVKITPFPVYHMRAVDNDVSEGRLNNTYGYLLEHEGRQIAYLGDYYRIPESSIKLINNADIVIADGTYLLTNKYRESKPNHVHGENIFSLTARLEAKNIYFHSVSHLTHQTHDQLQAQLPPKHWLTYDGLEVDLTT